MDDEQERIGDVPVMRHTEETPPEDRSDLDVLEAVSEHVEAHVGPIESVFHELVSERVHLDILVVAPSDERPYWWLNTCGMSSAPMAGAPPELGVEYERAELGLALPPTWSLEQSDFEDERVYWPIRLLKSLARLPHDYATWLWIGHTVPNGDPAEPYAEGVGFDGAIVLPPTLPSEGFLETLEIDGYPVTMLCPVPLLAAEMRFKLKYGTDTLVDGFERAGVDELVAVGRESAVPPDRRRFGFRRR